MKVLSLRCSQQHAFEGWFGSEEDFQSQFARGLVECPMCADKAIVKMPSAPRLNFGGRRPPAEPPLQSGDEGKSGSAELAAESQAHTPPDSGGSSRPIEALQTRQASLAAEPINPSPAQQAAFLKAVRQVLANTEDVGDRFADQARAMHYGDVEPRSIRGQATQREAVELMEEGIDVMALPIPAALKQTLQ